MTPSVKLIKRENGAEQYVTMDRFNQLVESGERIEVIETKKDL